LQAKRSQTAITIADSRRLIVASIAKSSGGRSKRKKVPTFADELVAMANDTISLDLLTPEEKERLTLWRDQLNDSAKALENIIAAHDALQSGAVDWSEPFDPHGEMNLNIALSAAFMISIHAGPNPIKARLIRENAASATQVRIDKSKMVDDLVVDVGRDLWTRHSTWANDRIADNILDELNKKLTEKNLPVLKKDAIRKRVKRLRTNGRPSS
jgi:hypothetical protein